MEKWHTLIHGKNFTLSAWKRLVHSLCNGQNTTPFSCTLPEHVFFQKDNVASGQRQSVMIRAIMPIGIASQFPMKSDNPDIPDVAVIAYLVWRSWQGSSSCLQQWLLQQ